MRKHRPTYEVQLFLQMNLTYELMKQGVAVSAISTAKDICDTIYCHSWLQSWHIPNKCDFTDTSLLHGPTEGS